MIACQDCGTNHYFEWELLRDNLEQMLTSGEPRPHEPAFDLVEDEYIQWDYGKGYVDAVADAGLEPDKRIEVTQCPWCETPFDGSFAFCPACGRTLATVRLYRELLDRGFDERDVRALLVRAGYEPFLDAPPGRVAPSSGRAHDGTARISRALGGGRAWPGSCSRSATRRTGCRV